MRRRQPLEGQASLFDTPPRKAGTPAPRRAEKPASGDGRTWRMPEASGGRTVAEIRLRWLKRLSPAQVARVEAELGSLPRTLTKLGYGPVEVERVFVRRRKS